ncbi:radical SAM protein [bacterium]|nr:radical SAM protein [bacterium]
MSLSNVDWRQVLGLRVSLPKKIDIEPTNTCNLACPLCPQSSSHTRKRGFMTLETFGNAISSFDGRVSEVSLYLHGEPFLNPDLPKFVKALSEAGIQTTIATNGLAITDECWRGVLDEGVNAVRFSMDLISRQGFLAYKGLDSYDEARSRLDELIEIKLGQKSDAHLGIRTIYSGQSREELLSFLEYYFKKPGIDDIWFTRPCPWPGSKDPEMLAGRLMKDRKQPCSIARESISICWDGSVVPCSFDHNAEYVLGNVNDAPLDEIVNSEAARSFRKLHANGRRDKIQPCADCMLPRFFFREISLNGALFNKANTAQMDNLFGRIEALMPKLEI